MKCDAMRRRDVITLLGGAAAYPLAARAQLPARMPVVGFLHSARANQFEGFVREFHRGLGEAGYVEGRNVAIEYRWAENQYDRLPDLVADLVRRQVTVIAALGTPETQAAKAGTATIPIVFTTANDPVQIGLVASLNRPGGNLTGVSTLNLEVGPKRLELLRELMPTASKVAALINPSSAVNAERLSKDLQAAGQILGLQVDVFNASTERDLETVFETLVRQRVQGLVIGTNNFFTSRSEQLAALALRHAIPAVYQYREFVAAGGLMSYGGSLMDLYRTVGVYTGRILKGEKPADLPVQQSMKVELLINMKTAKALGLTFPITILGRADEAIE
jgi:putative tryptophan/tyrosine transport system substrate-binding protein